MASSVPPEVLDLIFSELSESLMDLRSARLVCKSFAASAARHLFREVYVWPIKEYLQNLNKITSHSAFRKYVRTVVFSEEVFPWFENYDEWYYCAEKRSSQNLENLEDDHQADVLRNEYEKDLRANKVLKRNLTRALALMPNLENFHVNPVRRGFSIDKASILRVSQERLCDPLRFSEVEDDSTTSRQRCEMLDGLCDSNSQTTVIKGRILGRETLDHPLVPMHCLGRRNRHLTWNLSSYSNYSTVYLVGLIQMLETVLEVETLELSFYVDPDYPPVIFFDQIWPNVVHYGSLKCLTLAGFRMSQLRLLGFLSLHASTLRSLLLGDIEFEWKEARDKICAGSWTETIHFLEEHLNLTRVEIVGYLTSGLNETWYLEDQRYHCSSDWDYKPLTETLKYRIEQYIVKGGICPLDLPCGREQDNKMEYWREIEDYSCRFPERWNSPHYDE